MRVIICLLAGLLFSATAIAHVPTVELAVSASKFSNTVSGDEVNFGKSEGYGVAGFYYLSQYFAIELGLHQSTPSKSYGYDSQGSWKISLESYDVTLGAKLQTQYHEIFGEMSAPVALYMQGGYLNYSAKFKVEESFYSSLPSTVSKATTKGNGFYFGGGVGVKVGSHFFTELGASYSKKSNLFKSSSRAFDIKQAGPTFRLIYSF